MSLNPASLEPQRNPSLVQRVWRAVVGATPDLGPQPAQQNTSETGRVSARSNNRTLYSKTDLTRTGIYADADEMDRSSAEFSRALNTIADNVTTSEDGEQQSFDIECEDAGALKVIDDLVERADLHGLMPSWTRRTVKYGDAFVEIVVNSNLEVASVKQLPSDTMTRNEDDYGNLRMGEPKFNGQACTNDPEECAFDQFDPSGQHLMAAFFPWQIVHTRLFWDGISRYGTSLGNVARIDWRKLHALEEGMVVGRLTRAYLKLIVYADGTGMSREQKQSMLRDLHNQISQTQQYADQKRGSNLSVLDNIYLTKEYVRSGGEVKESLTKIDLMDPKNEGLSNIDDIKHFHRKFLASLVVPPAYMSFEDQVNAKATLTKEDVQFVRFLRSVQKLMSGALVQVIDTELILKGYDPDQVDYKIKWPTLSAEDEQLTAAANFTQAQADDIYVGFGVIDKAWMQQHRFGMDEDEMADIAEPAPPPTPLQVTPIPQPPIAKPTVAAERLSPALEALAVSNQRMHDKLDVLATNGKGHKVMTAEAVETGVHVHFEKGAIQNDVNPTIRVQPAALKAPDVVVNVPELQPTIRVGGPVVNIPEQPTPVVNVHPEVKGPDVNVHVPPSDPPADLEIERDSYGDIKALKRRKPR